MAVHASTLQRRQRAESDASSDAGDARRNKGKRARDAESSDDEGDQERALANLDIKDPVKTCRHLFLQALISRRTIALDLADALYKECVKLCRGA